MFSGVFKGGACATPFGLPVNFSKLLDNFCTVSVSFVSRLNYKIRVAISLRLLVTVSVFSLLKVASKCTQTNHFGTKLIVFLGRGLSHLHTILLDAYGASPPPY